MVYLSLLLQFFGRVGDNISQFGCNLKSKETILLESLLIISLDRFR